MNNETQNINFKRSFQNISDSDSDNESDSEKNKRLRGESYEETTDDEDQMTTDNEQTPDEEEEKMDDEEKIEEKMADDEKKEGIIKRKLLDLTPVCLQKTDTIFNTLLFMCLDQGHDFRAGDSRTTTTDGQSTWVDYDFFVSNKKLCYLNKIKQDKFNKEYIQSNDTEEKQITIGPEKIFGQNDFIKGLLNTTFIGGNGAYGLVVIEDTNLEKLGQEKELFIVNKITENINIKLKLINSNYYIYSDNDTDGDSGKTFEINGSEILFLPFYQRVYNNGMHKLW